MTNIGKVLKHYREREGLTQRELARSLGYDKSQYISNIERGLSPFNPKKVAKLSSVLKTKPFVFKKAMIEDYKKHLDRLIK